MNLAQVKTLGRTLLLQDILYLSHSASGIEFYFEGSLLKIQVVTERGIDYFQKKEDAPRIGIWMNDTLLMDLLIQTPEQEVIILDGPLCSGIIRICKLSESQHSTLGIRSLITEGAKISPTPKKSILIEFIGDSITCGYGVDGDLNLPFSTGTENATKTYAYLASKTLDVDYSMVAFSGHGLLSGYTSDGIINTNCLVQPLYLTFGASLCPLCGKISPRSLQWEYTKEYEPDIILINLGTNDQSYVQGDSSKTKEFQKAYFDFLVQIRAIHPKSTLLCTLGIMGDELYSAIEETVVRFKEETLDYNIASFSFTPQLAVNGYGSDYHPSYHTAQQAADELVSFLTDATNLPIFAPVLSITETNR